MASKVWNLYRNGAQVGPSFTFEDGREAMLKSLNELGYLARKAGRTEQDDIRSRETLRIISQAPYRIGVRLWDLKTECDGIKLELRRGASRPMLDRNAPEVGKRVQLPAWSDQWMRGARFGRIVSVRHTMKGDVYEVRCDHPSIKRLYRHFATEFEFVA